jgi:hypothetical protein
MTSDVLLYMKKATEKIKKHMNAAAKIDEELQKIAENYFPSNFNNEDILNLANNYHKGSPKTTPGGQNSADNIEKRMKLSRSGLISGNPGPDNLKNLKDNIGRKKDKMNNSYVYDDSKEFTMIPNMISHSSGSIHQDQRIRRASSATSNRTPNISGPSLSQSPGLNGSHEDFPYFRFQIFFLSVFIFILY